MLRLRLTRHSLVMPTLLAFIVSTLLLWQPAHAWTGVGCTWPHTPGQFTFVYHMWGDAIDADPYTNWRAVFTEGRNDWNGAQGRLRIIEVANTPGQYNSHWLANDGLGETWLSCSGGSITSYVASGNRFNSPIPSGAFGLIGDHEIGHTLGLGHSDPVWQAVMVSFWYEGQPTYPQPDDVNGIDALYP